MNTRPRIFVVDDDAAVRDSLGLLLQSEGYAVETYGSATEFLAHCRPEEAGCLILDISMPGMDGLELQKALARQGMSLPIIFLTGRGDYSVAKRAFMAGAVAFLDKPPDPDALLAKVRAAIRQDP
jgi:FixJ family two-component response regulator